MLEIIKDENENIKGVLEWYLVDEKGAFSSSGEFVWVNEVFISPQFRNNGMLKEFVRKVIERCPQAKFGYFWRERKYKGRGIRIYHKARWLKLLKGGRDVSNT